uniref:cilia- and flagella-associated protein 206 isoform X2 n=1 Tax=Myxine glutinosa TaxID=7769 RepID=UPI003590180F
MAAASAQTETVIKNIIREILRECGRHGHVVSEMLAAFMLKAVILHPESGFDLHCEFDTDDVTLLIKSCVDRLLCIDKPSLETIKMQVYFDTNYTTHVDFFKERKWEADARLAQVIRGITESRAQTKEELQGLYKNIITYALLRSGLGSTTVITVVREATAAMHSIFPPTELGTFLTLKKQEKERHLSELTSITTGIRLFNKKSGKGGEGIENLPDILSETIQAVRNQLDLEIPFSLQLSFKYTALLERTKQDKQLLKDGLSPDLIKELLFNSRQHECFLKTLTDDLVNSTQRVEKVRELLSKNMEQVKETIGSKSAVLTSQVYPVFIEVAQAWSSLQDELAFLSTQKKLLSELKPFLTVHEKLCPESVLKYLLGDEDVKSDDQRMQDSTGNPEIGIFKHHEKLYVFSSKEAAHAFAANPDLHVHTVANAARRSPELLRLLDLHQNFPSLEHKPCSVKTVTTSDFATQTDTHILGPNINKSYEWNEWELRRQAIKLANIRLKVTHSVQTMLSHMRRDNETQLYSPREVACQTARDNSSSMPKAQVYLAGLRGLRTNFREVDLTRKVDES